MRNEYTLGDLIENLRQLVEQGVDEDTPVLVAYQQNYPLTGTVQDISVLGTEDDDDGEGYHVGGDHGICMEPEAGDLPDGDAVVWLAIGSAPCDVNPYAPKQAWGN